MRAAPSSAEHTLVSTAPRRLLPRRLSGLAGAALVRAESCFVSSDGRSSSRSLASTAATKQKPGPLQAPQPTDPRTRSDR